MADKVLVHGALTVKVLSAKGIANKDGGFSGLSDPYALVSIDGKEVARTAVIDNTLSPKWKAAYEFDVIGERRELQVELFNKNSVFRDDHLGLVSFGFKDILAKQKFKVRRDMISGYLVMKSGVVVLSDEEDELLFRQSLSMAYCVSPCLRVTILSKRRATTRPLKEVSSYRFATSATRNWTPTSSETAPSQCIVAAE